VKDNSDGDARWRTEACKLFRSSFSCFATHISWDRQPGNFPKFWTSQL